MSRRPRTVAELRAIHADAQDAVQPPAGIEHVAIIAADELERALARNAILEQKVKRLEFRLTAADGALQGLSRRLMAFYEATPDNLAIVKALNAETAAAVKQHETPKAQRCGLCRHWTSDVRRCDACKAYTCTQCSDDASTTQCHACLHPLVYSVES